MGTRETRGVGGRRSTIASRVSPGSTAIRVSPLAERSIPAAYAPMAIVDEMVIVAASTMAIR